MSDVKNPARVLRMRPLATGIGLALAMTPAMAQTNDAASPWQMALQARQAMLPNTDTRSNAHAPKISGGTTWTVTSCEDDDSPGTLRAVLLEVNDGDTVDLSQLECSVITLTQGTLDIGVFGDNHVYQLSLIGPGRDQLAIDGNSSARVLAHRSFNAADARLDISDLAIRNGSYAGGLASCIDANSRVGLTRVDVSNCHTTGGGPTFAAAVNAGHLAMASSTITDSSAGTDGAGDSRVVLGAVYAKSAELTDSTISGNTISSESGGNGATYFTGGGGLYIRGDLDMRDSTISGNSASTQGDGLDAVGGGIFVTGDATITNSVMDGNTVDGEGGGIFKARFSNYGDPGTTLTIDNSTVSGNGAGRGGGISSARPASVGNSTITANHAVDGAAGMLFLPAGEDDLTFDFQSTIIAGNSADDGAALPADLGSAGNLQVTGANNLIMDAGALELPLDTLSDDPLLAPLADNGGPTRTHALTDDSPAIDAGNNQAGLDFDQRGEGFPRMLGDAADIGAFEAEVVIREDLIFQDRFEFEAVTGPIEYSYDDGDGDANQGPPSSFDPDMLWGSYFLTETGGEVITEISVAFGPTFPSLDDGPVTFWLLDDPDMDLDPRNATALTSVTGTPDVFNDEFVTVKIPPTQVSGAFFVGASAKLLGGEDRPARVDTDAPGDKSWFFYAPEIADVINDLASAPFGARMDDPEFVVYPGTFMIRATGVPGDD